MPAEVAANLDQYCWEFAASWVWHGPENGKFLHQLPNGQYGAMFGAEDAGILAVNGEDNKSEAALARAEALGKSL